MTADDTLLSAFLLINPILPVWNVGCELQLAPFLLYRHEERGLQCCLFLWVPPQLFQLLFLQEWEWEAVGIGEELLMLQGVLSSPPWAQTSNQLMLWLSFHLTYAKGFKTGVCHMAQKMLSHPSLVTSGLKTSEVITAINPYSISPKERRQLLTIPLLNAK